MTWVEVYLSCLLVGLVLSALSLLGGAFHFHLPGHWGHLHFGGRIHLGPRGGHAHGGRGSELSVANFSARWSFAINR